MITPAAQASPVDNVSYEDLYARWERGNWRAMELDFSVDAKQWQSDFTDFERKAAIWNYSLFFWGEDAVADGLSPYIDAAPLEEQKYFLTTQQVDEARHAVFFNRFMKEVVGIGGDSVAEGLTAIEPNLNWGFRQVFDRLETMCGELRRNPSVPQLAAAITLYHVVIEATLAQTGQNFITRYLTDRDLLPAFREGMENVANDEHRHIAFGVKLLSDLHQKDAEVPHAVNDLLREVLPWAVAVIVPPDWNEEYITVFGSTSEALAEEGTIPLMSKLRSAGMPLDDLPGPAAFPVEGTPRERAVRTKRLLQCGYIGEKTRPPSTGDEDLGLFFESVATALDSDAAAEPGAIQWEFTDAEPWHVVVANGSTRAERGRADHPRLTLKASLEDFVDVAANREDPKRLVARGRLRARGDLRWVWKSRRMFPV